MGGLMWAIVCCSHLKHKFHAELAEGTRAPSIAT